MVLEGVDEAGIELHILYGLRRRILLELHVTRIMVLSLTCPFPLTDIESRGSPDNRAINVPDEY